MEFGFGMQGMEDRIITITRAVAAKFDEVTYVEIGVGEGTTLTAVASTLRSNSNRWRAIGVELPNGYSFSRDKTLECSTARNLRCDFITPTATNIQRAYWGQVTVFLKDSQTFLTEMWQEPIHFALIDGCHGKPCVIQDFLAIEAWAVKGALVMFHDYGVDQVGQSQPHCPGGVDVRGACQQLGLIDKKNRREGWRFLEELTGDKAHGAWDMGIFQKEM